MIPRYSFPAAQQAQISEYPSVHTRNIELNHIAFKLVRATQRDAFHLFTLKDYTESVLRSWLGPSLHPSPSAWGLIQRYPGTRWLTRWEKEVDLIVKLAYYGLTTGLGQ